MSTSAYLNETKKISVTFYGWQDEVSSPVDPNTVTINILDTATTPDTVLGTDAPTHDVNEIGVYNYLWTPDTIGNYNVQFVATFADSSTDLVNNFFTVYESTTIPGEGGTGGLLTDYTIEYLAELSPLYLDPEEIKAIYPLATNVQITELIYQYSGEVQALLSLGTSEPPYIAIEYVYAATACALSRIYGDTSATSGNVDSFRLGDLEVRKDTSSTSSQQSTNQGSATTWCEIAAMLKADMINYGAGYKVLRKGKGGGDYPYLIPHRTLRSYENSNWDSHWIGIN